MYQLINVNQENLFKRHSLTHVENLFQVWNIPFREQSLQAFLRNPAMPYDSIWPHHHIRDEGTCLRSRLFLSGWSHDGDSKTLVICTDPLTWIYIRRHSTDPFVVSTLYKRPNRYACSGKKRSQNRKSIEMHQLVLAYLFHLLYKSHQSLCWTALDYNLNISAACEFDVMDTSIIVIDISAINIIRFPYFRELQRLQTVRIYFFGDSHFLHRL